MPDQPNTTQHDEPRQALSAPPSSLFLQWDGDGDYDPDEAVMMAEVTWFRDRIFRGDKQYISAEIVRELYESAGKRMMADDPTGEERFRFLEAWKQVGEILENKT